MAERKNLTARFCETAKAPESGQKGYLDDTVRGLELRVGAVRKSWCLRYRNSDGVQRRLTLGEFDKDGYDPANPPEDPLHPGALNLDQARTAARAALVLIKQGKDPSHERQTRRAAAKAKPVKTVNDLVDAYLEACRAGLWTPRSKRQRPRTLADQRGAFDRHLKAQLGDEKLAQVTRAKVRAALRDLQKKGLTAQLRQAQQCLRQAYAWGIAEEHVDDNPATNLPRFAASKPKTRVLSDEELKQFWTALEDPADLKGPDGKALHVSRAHAIALELCALLLQRRAEIAGIMDSELDLEQLIWRLPAERSKNGREHLIPLQERAVELIREAQELRPEAEGVNDRPLFPSRRDPTKPMHPDTLSHVMVDMLAALKLPAAGPHDLRRGGSSALTSERIGVSPFIRSLVLGHVSDAGGGAAVSRQHYDVNQYLPQKRQALVAWEGLLLNIVEARPIPANVRSLRGAAA